MEHPKFPSTYEVESLASQILSMAEERDYWRRQALRYQHMHEEHMDDLDKQLKQHEENAGNILMAILDPDSGINCMARAVQRDPLKGAKA
jgi:hypothetical protein